MSLALPVLGGVPPASPGYLPYPLPALSVSTLRRSVVAALKADPAVNQTAGGRVYPLRVPENGSLPAALYYVSSESTLTDLDGPAGAAFGRIEVACGAQDYADAEAMRNSVRRTFAGFQGDLGGGVHVYEIESDGEDDVYDPPDDASDRGTFWIVLKYRIFYEEG